jgi:cytochrome oxidase Cu insertion factor (SCO1/SenC/PrrC family)
MWAVIAFAVLGLGGVIGDHFLGNFEATTTTLHQVKSTTTTQPLSSLTPTQYIGLKLIGNTKASAFTLYDQAGTRWSLSSAKGKVVVLTFYNSICNDACSMLGEEISEAQALLGTNADKVDFVIVNTDPNAAGVSARPRALTVPGLVHSRAVYFLTGSIQHLDSVWSDYGIVVKVGAKPTEVTHNNVFYFIGRGGQIEAFAQPFGKVNHVGIFTLAPADLHRYAKGIAQAASSLFQ